MILTITDLCFPNPSMVYQRPGRFKILLPSPCELFSFTSFYFLICNCHLLESKDSLFEL